MTDKIVITDKKNCNVVIFETQTNKEDKDSIEIIAPEYVKIKVVRK